MVIKISRRFAFSLAIALFFSHATWTTASESTRVRVASISFQPKKLDVERNAATLEKYFREAAAGGARLAVAPEGILEGYIINEILSREIPVERMRDVALKIDSPMIGRFRDLAKELEICLVFGFAEAIGTNVFNTAVFIDHEGRICGKYHKMQFHEGYDSKWWFNRLGASSRAFDTPLGRCGILICNDRWNPALAKIPALDGAQFLVIPSFGSTSDRQDEAVLSRAVENHLPVVEANVGVSMIISDDKPVAVRRQVEGVTCGEILIPAPRPSDPVARDRTEAEFLAWREKEMPQRLASSLLNLDPRGKARAQDTVALKTSELSVLIGNNRSLEIDGREHAAGYNGLFQVISTRHEPTDPNRISPFVFRYAGFNLEHYFDGKAQENREVFFEPRYSRLETKQVDAQTVELHQPPTSHFQVESWTKFRVREPHYIDFNFRCVPHRDDYVGRFLGVFWASYINGPLDKSIYFLDRSSTDARPLWRQLCTQQHNRDSTSLSSADELDLKFEDPDTLFANFSPLRYSQAFFSGRFDNMVLIYIFRPGENLRFAHSPSGGGTAISGDDTNPAWDFQMVIPEIEANKEYTLNGRLVYKPWHGRDDVLAEVRRYRAHDGQ